jgi:chloramphenicol-sensitive protein RarD
VVWSLLLLGGLLAASRRIAPLRSVLGDGRRLLLLAGTATLLSVNWFLYIWAVNSGRLLEASLGYFVNPLVNVLLGVLFLGERLSVPQRWAVAFAGAGVAVLLLSAGTFPWVSLSLALSFGLYGLLRKRAPVDALEGLLVETAWIAPVAAAFLLRLGARGEGAFGSGAATTALLVSAGAVTALPLLWFNHGVRRLRLSTIGLVQYLAPTTQFLLAVLAYREPFGPAHAAAFACIWASLAIYSADALARARRAAPAAR